MLLSEVIFVKFSKTVVVAGNWLAKDDAQDGGFACVSEANVRVTCDGMRRERKEVFSALFFERCLFRKCQKL